MFAFVRESYFPVPQSAIRLCLTHSAVCATLEIFYLFPLQVVFALCAMFVPITISPERYFRNSKSHLSFSLVI
jgi:hypothetical protein